MNKNFSYFIISSASTLLSIEIFHLAVPLTVLALGYTAVQASWCTFSFFLPVIFTKIFAAPVIENSDKKKGLLNNEIMRTLSILVFLLVLYFIRDNALIGMIVLISFLFGVCTSLTEIIEPTALKMLLKGQNAASIISKYEIRTRAVQLLAPTLCGVLISTSLFLPYTLALIISFLSIYLLFKLNLVLESVNNPAQGNIFKRITEAVSWLKGNVLFSRMVLLTSINNFLHPILYLTIIYQLTHTDTGFDITGYILSGLGVGGIIGSFISNYLSKTFQFNQLVISVNILRILVFAGFVIFPHPWGYFFFFVFKAILGGVWNVCYNIYTIKEMPQSHIARISALSGLIIKSFTALGSLSAGYLIKYTGVNNTLYFLIILTVGMFLCTLNIKKFINKAH